MRPHLTSSLPAARRLAIALCLTGAGLLLLGACTDAPTGPSSNPAREGAGPLVVAMETAEQETGALFLTISGAAIDSITAAGRTVYRASPGTTTHHAILTDELKPGPIAVAWVRDRAAALSASLRVEQASHLRTYAPIDPSRYALRYLPPLP